ncbi:hypothetical protein BDW02DRAFT_645901 [Decorospora gaudefroyi]|uniref:Uncharacterized protein n=1 Tax=Decorospora gaudefroyi TaxID=184978 RepID=A0A6A5KM02_9PLEO|nr:hypothetical protein BDW02DRAFT_645901 [Decorospora gaudefroyi]
MPSKPNHGDLFDLGYLRLPHLNLMYANSDSRLRHIPLRLLQCVERSFWIRVSSSISATNLMPPGAAGRWKVSSHSGHARLYSASNFLRSSCPSCSLSSQRRRVLGRCKKKMSLRSPEKAFKPQHHYTLNFFQFHLPIYSNSSQIQATNMSSSAVTEARNAGALVLTPATHKAHCVRAMQRVIDSLIDRHNSHESIMSRAAETEERLTILRADRFPKALAIHMFEQVLLVTRRHITAHLASEIDFIVGLRNPAHSDPAALEKFVAESDKKYMEMTRKMNSECYMATKHRDSPMSAMVAKFHKMATAAVKSINPEWAERMKRWDADRKKGGDKDGGEAGGQVN